MKKRFFSVTMVLLLVGILSAQIAQAAGQRAVSQKPDLFFQGTTAICSAICQGDIKTDKIVATLTLYQGNTYINSWSGARAEKITLYGKCTAIAGKTYRLEVAYSIN